MAERETYSNYIGSSASYVTVLQEDIQITENVSSCSSNAAVPESSRVLKEIEEPLRNRTSSSSTVESDMAYYILNDSNQKSSSENVLEESAIEDEEIGNADVENIHRPPLLKTLKRKKPEKIEDTMITYFNKKINKNAVVKKKSFVNLFFMSLEEDYSRLPPSEQLDFRVRTIQLLQDKLSKLNE